MKYYVFMHKCHCKIKEIIVIIFQEQSKQSIVIFLNIMLFLILRWVLLYNLYCPIMLGLYTQIKEIIVIILQEQSKQSIVIFLNIMLFQILNWVLLYNLFCSIMLSLCINKGNYCYYFLRIIKIVYSYIFKYYVVLNIKLGLVVQLVLFNYVVFMHKQRKLLLLFCKNNQKKLLLLFCKNNQNSQQLYFQILCCFKYQIGSCCTTCSVQLCCLYAQIKEIIVIILQEQSKQSIVISLNIMLLYVLRWILLYNLYCPIMLQNSLVFVFFEMMSQRVNDLVRVL
eukprot:TRINITY_DN8688_c0_g2_i7.p1 TRINITY_DN8688_c0_g2~~TRINITY_DN8688_c0_g2_i7.p1  ORF type:complete len:282 (+),score=-16.07 TRINITY_DN8688_c0_g2_i7:1981-2826(+)